MNHKLVRSKDSQLFYTCAAMPYGPAKFTKNGNGLIKSGSIFSIGVSGEITLHQNLLPGKPRWDTKPGKCHM